MSVQPKRGLPPGPVVVVAALVLVAGLGVDLGYTRRQMEEYERLLETRSALQEARRAGELVQREERIASAYFGAESLEEALEALTAEDAVAFLDRSIREAGLRRRGLNAHERRTVGSLQRIGFFVEASGPYDRVHAFLRQLEDGPRVVTVEGIVLMPVPGTNQVEARIDLAVYDPR